MPATIYAVIPPQVLLEAAAAARKQEAAMAVESESALIQGLLREEAYRHEARDIQLHETHGAWVVLAGPYAYKLKKPVDFGFFDFSTPELRAADAEAEVRLNRRLAPSIYLGIVDIVERDGEIKVGGPGRLIERAVWMHRLPAGGMLSAELQRDSVRPSLVRRIARVMARFHATAATGPGVDEHGGHDTLTANWDENFSQCEPYVDQSVPAAEFRLIRAYVTETLRTRRALFERRVKSGRIRDGHGDLHARSICIDGRNLVIFDCIEFADRYRCADVAAEVAFLAMDLDHYGRPDLGWAFVDEYVRRSGDRELLELLDFYKCYRAVVRGKVLSLRLAEADLAPDKTAAVIAEARAYFDLATVYAGGIPRPLLVATCGLPGSGKTSLAQALAHRLGMLLISTDVVRKRRAGLHPTTRAGAAFGTGLYDARTTRATYAALRRGAALWLRRGVSVILDGTFSHPTQRGAVRRLAARAGAGFLIAQTSVADDIVSARIRARESDPTRASDATHEIYARMRATFVPPDEIPPSERYLDESGGGGADHLIDHLTKGQAGPE